MSDLEKLESAAEHLFQTFASWPGDMSHELQSALSEFWQEWATNERLKELCQAEREGRAVVLPVKVGDIIFSFYWSIKNQKYEVCTGEAKNVRFDAIDGSVLVSDGERYRVWGKTVFLTREAAEQAMKEGEKVEN